MLNKELTLTQLENIVIDAGLVFADYDEAGEKIMAPTRGGNVMTITPEYKAVERDGARGKEKGMKRLISLEAIMTVRLMDMTKETLLQVLGCVKLEGNILKNDMTVTADKYLKNITIIAESMGGKYKRFSIYNPFNDEGAEISFEDKNESVLEIKFHGHFDPMDSDQSLFEIEDFLVFPVI